MSEPEGKKLCFVISPIGAKDSSARIRSDKVLKHIIKPVAEEQGYEVIRADKISKPGLITTQIFQHLLDDPLVIADFTGHNPNVFYETAIRHVIGKPIVQIIEKGVSLPFDVAQSRTIQVDHTDLDSVEECKEELRRQIVNINETPGDIDNPFSSSLDVKSLHLNSTPHDWENDKFFSILQELHSMIGELREGRRDDTRQSRNTSIDLNLKLDNEISHAQSLITLIHKSILAARYNEGTTQIVDDLLYYGRERLDFLRGMAYRSSDPNIMQRVVSLQIHFDRLERDYHQIGGTSLPTEM